MYKVVETTTHIFFLTGPYSNWHITPFHGKLEPDGPTILFNCGEQYMMAAKAHLFKDRSSFEQIMQASHPSQQKPLGRAVANFDIPTWSENARKIVFRACWFKQEENEEYRTALLSGQKYLVEGNKNDTIWGVGVHYDDPAIQNPQNWRGTNWLGEAHMSVRLCLNELKQFRALNPKASFDPWLIDR